MEPEAPPPENEPPSQAEELTVSEVDIKADPGVEAAPEDMYEAPVEEDLYDGGDNMEPEDDYQGGGAVADPPPEEQQPVAVAGPSDGTPTGKAA